MLHHFRRIGEVVPSFVETLRFNFLVHSSGAKLEMWHWIVPGSFQPLHHRLGLAMQIGTVLQLAEFYDNPACQWNVLLGYG